MWQQLAILAFRCSRLETIDTGKAAMQPADKRQSSSCGAQKPVRLHLSNLLFTLLNPIHQQEYQHIP